MKLNWALARPALALWLSMFGIAATLPAFGADHGDTPLLIDTSRHDARLADLFAYVRGDDLVLILTLDPTISAAAQEYVFPTDVKYRLFIDNDSEVHFSDVGDVENFGGTIVDPDHIQQDIELQIKFRKSGEPKLGSEGLHRRDTSHVRVFAGLRDDPFIRAPREGRNIAAIVLQFPLSLVVADQSTLLIWATSMVQELRGSQQELVGRALRSQFPENDQMNTLHPSEHHSRLGVAPDVIVLDTRYPSAHPNGRVLEDDVVDLVCFAPEAECRVFNQANEGRNGPSENDVPFLDTFPYLSPPQL